MSAITTSPQHYGITNATRGARLGRLVGMVGLTFAIILGFSNLSKSESPATIESIFVEAVQPTPARLRSARDAEKRGDHELAIHDYLGSIQEDVLTAESAIEEMVAVFLSMAKVHCADGRYVDQSAQINRCYHTLTQLKQADSTTEALPEAARKRLFEAIARVRSAGKAAAKLHVDAADQLRTEAKRFWHDH